jgi:hypothetical protein
MERRDIIVGIRGDAVAVGSSAASGESSTLSSREHFRELVKRNFRIYDEGSRFLDELQLVAIEDGPGSTGLDQFDLVFEGVFGDDLAEGTYVLQETRSRRAYAMHLQDRERTRKYRATFRILK